MKKTMIILALILCCNTGHAQDDTLYREGVTYFINCIKYNKRDTLAAAITYPFRRQYPLPYIEDKREFIGRYDEIFDTELINAIVHSNIRKDWSRVGWRGIMFHRGDVWLDDDGRLIAVNHQSAKEKTRRAQLIAQDRASLHESLRVYKEPVCILETAKFRVRIDGTANGKYRYASWAVGSKMSDKPDLVMENGTIEFDGSGGNHAYIFKKAGYTYTCDILLMGEDGWPPARLVIQKGGREILSQRASLKGN